MKILGKCPKCGSPDGLFICSFMAVNCADCHQYIRRATKEEIQAKFEYPGIIRIDINERKVEET